MRNLVPWMCLLASFWVGSSLVRAQGVQFASGTFEEAQLAAQVQNKMLMLVVVADWMDGSQILVNEIFAEPRVGAAFKDRFVVWKLDADLLVDGPYFAGIRILSIPEYIFFDAAGSPQYRDQKLKDSDELIAMAAAAMDPANHLSQLAKRYESGDRTPAMVSRYVVEMDAAGKDMRVACREYLTQIAPKALLETENWIIATIGVQQISEPAFHYVIDHLAAFKQQYGEQPVNDFVVKVYRNSLTLAVTEQDLALLGACQAVVRQLLGIEDAKPVILQDELTFLASGTNWKAYFDKALSLFSVYELEDARIYNEVAWNIFLHLQDPAILKQAIVWAKRSVELEPTYWNWHTLGSLQWRSGNMAAAMASAQEALKLAAPDTPEEDEVQDLIERIQK